jgi:UDP-N-acetylglucosamine--N-acetylmuramyl-(pentapeptide) pyrophosphoryl-undecaprenol N-acetylglucosamine transferase
MPTPKKIVLTGTHITPALEFIRQLQNDTDTSWEIFFIGRIHNSSVDTSPAIESKIIPKIGVKYFGIDCGKFDRRYFPNTLNGIPQIFSAFIKASKILGQIKPHLVLSFGGYLSVPVVFAAAIKGIPSVTHEQTSTLSLSTRINSLFSKYIALSFPINTFPQKYIVTGNLLRREIFSESSPLFQKIKFLKLPLLFVTAGNQGSRLLNNQIRFLLPNLTQHFNIVHQTGNNDFPDFQKLSSQFTHYYPFPYIESPDIGWILNRACLMISRAGANTCQEITALKIKSVLIPLKISQQNEQMKNADFVKSLQPDITIVIPEINLNSKILLKSIQKLSAIKKPKDPPEALENLKLLKLIKTF